MQMTSRDERMLEWLRVVRMAEMPALRWALGGFSGAGEPVSLRKAQQWVARCRAAGLVKDGRPMYQSSSVVWPTSQIIEDERGARVRALPAPNLLRQTVRHDLAVAAVAARYVCAGWAWSADRDPEQRHQADGIGRRGDVFELVEIELTTKTLDRYLKIFGSHDERIRFDGVTSVLYVTDERTGQSISRQIEQRVHVDDRARFTVLPVLDGWGRVQDDLWPYATPRFTPAAAGAQPEQLPAPSGLF